MDCGTFTLCYDGLPKPSLLERITADSLVLLAARDTLSNQDAVEMVSEVLQQACGTGCSAWNETTGMQQAAEALTHEAYVRGSKDNIGVVVVAVD
jgi:serine/threonine protein phosphatase PrpC